MSEPLRRPIDRREDDGDTLLATKLYTPPVGAGFVARPQLVASLDEQVNQDLVLVSAPAGFGKTSLLAEWVDDTERPVAWLSLDSGDNDPVRFWRHVAAALDRAYPGIFSEIGWVGRGTSQSIEGWLIALINVLANERDEEVVLILDDYHVIDTQLIHDTLQFLLDHLPSGLHLVLATRADPPLPLALFRSRGQLVEIRAAELRFTTEEAAALLHEVVGSHLDPDSASALATRTEGWVAGLQMAALSLRGRPDIEDFVATFSGSHRFVLDYLTEEVLERHTPGLRHFLLETSVLDRLSGDLCDAVTGQDDGQETLEWLERANLFMVPLDDVRGWWRYHHLFADMLRARLQQSQPERMLNVHHRAARWHDDHGLTNDAVRHALASGDAIWAARLIERHVDRLDGRGEGATIRRWLGALPAEVVASRPRLLLTQARSALFVGDMEQVEILLDTAEDTLADADEEPFEPSVGRGASILANLPASIALDRAALATSRGDAQAAITFAHDAQARIDADEWRLDALADMFLGVAEWLCGRLGDAERALASSVERWRVAGQPTFTAYGAHYLGRIQYAQGRLDAALQTYQQTLDMTTTAGQPDLPAAGVAYLGMAEVAYQRNDVDASLHNVTRGIDLARCLPYIPLLAPGLITLAWIRQAAGDSVGALEAMSEAEQMMPGPEVVDLLNPPSAQHARLLLTQGDVAAVAEWTSKHGLEADDQPDYPRESAYLVLARLLLAQDRPDDALQLLDRLNEAADRQGRVGSLIEIQALRSQTQAALGEEAGAVAALEEAIAHARPEGFIRLFVDEGRPMEDLLGLYVASRTAREPGPTEASLRFVNRILEAFGEHNANTVRGKLGGGMVVPLTDREVEVLELIAAGKPNREIGDELYIGVDTVKKHITHILDKVGAANRTEAAALAPPVWPPHLGPSRHFQELHLAFHLWVTTQIRFPDRFRPSGCTRPQRERTSMTTTITHTSTGFEKGFDDQSNEVSLPSLEIDGDMPDWLSGTLVRNGPARFRLQDKTLNHWFDGLGMLHKFDIADGKVGYANKYLDTPAYRAAEAGEMRYSEFATDPCRSLFKRVTQLFNPPEFGGNANVTIGKIAEDFVAQTEGIPMAVAFDTETLDTIGFVDFDDQLGGDVTTAHPHHDPVRRAAYNYLLEFGIKSKYGVFELPDGTKNRRMLGSPTASKPSYMHSFAISEQYVILMEFPFVVNPLRMLVSGKPFIANYRWEPERGTRFSLVDRRTGEVTYAHLDEAWFGFHHVNAVDRKEDGMVDVDIIVYPNADVVQHFYLNSLLDRPNRNTYPDSELRRFTINVATGEVTSRTLVDHSAELPRINYSQHNTKPYRYVYANGIAERGESVFLDTIVKFDVESGEVDEWKSENHFPGEPVFVPRPDAGVEDDVCC